MITSSIIKSKLRKRPLIWNSAVLFYELALCIIVMGVLVNGIIEWEKAFWILALFILIQPLLSLGVIYITVKSLRIWKTIILIIIGVINLVIIFFTTIVWIDLFDGSTNVLF